MLGGPLRVEPISLAQHERVCSCGQVFLPREVRFETQFRKPPGSLNTLSLGPRHGFFIGRTRRKQLDDGLAAGFRGYRDSETALVVADIGLTADYLNLWGLEAEVTRKHLECGTAFVREGQESRLTFKSSHAKPVSPRMRENVVVSDHIVRWNVGT